MSQDTFDNLEKLIHDNAALREALSLAPDMNSAAQSITDAAVAINLKCTPGQISEFLSGAIARGLLPITSNELDSLVGAGGASPLYDPKKDPYWSELDLPLDASPSTRGYQGKSG